MAHGKRKACVAYLGVGELAVRIVSEMFQMAFHSILCGEWAIRKCVSGSVGDVTGAAGVPQGGAGWEGQVPRGGLSVGPGSQGRTSRHPGGPVFRARVSCTTFRKSVPTLRWSRPAGEESWRPCQGHREKYDGRENPGNPGNKKIRVRGEGGRTYSAMSIAQMPVPHPKSMIRVGLYGSAEGLTGAVCSCPRRATSNSLW